MDETAPEARGVRACIPQVQKSGQCVSSKTSRIKAAMSQTITVPSKIFLVLPCALLIMGYSGDQCHPAQPSSHECTLFPPAI